MREKEVVYVEFEDDRKEGLEVLCKVYTRDITRGRNKHRAVYPAWSSRDSSPPSWSGSCLQSAYCFRFYIAKLQISTRSAIGIQVLRGNQIL